MGGSELGWVEHQAHPPPLDIARVTSSTYFKGGTKLLKGGTKLLKGGTKLLKGGTKLLKGGTKLLKGGTKSLGWATGGGRPTHPTPPPPWLRAWNAQSVAQFWKAFNILRADFGTLYPYLQCKLFKQYCCSFYWQ